MAETVEPIIAATGYSHPKTATHGTVEPIIAATAIIRQLLTVQLYPKFVEDKNQTNGCQMPCFTKSIYIFIININIKHL